MKTIQMQIGPKHYSGLLGVKLIPACHFPFICCKVIALSNQTGLGLKNSSIMNSLVVHLKLINAIVKFNFFVMFVTI